MILQIVNIEIYTLYMSRKAKKCSRRLKLKSSRDLQMVILCTNLIRALGEYTIFFGGNHWMFGKLLTEGN